MEVVVIDCLEEDAALALSPFVAAAVVANERMASNRGSNTSAIGLNFGNIILDLGSFSLLWIHTSRYRTSGLLDYDYWTEMAGLTSPTGVLDALPRVSSPSSSLSDRPRQ